MNTGLTVFFQQPRPYQMTSHLIMHSSKHWSYSCGPILMSGCCDVCFRRWQDQTLAICPSALQSMPQLSSSSCCTKSSRVTLWSDTLMRSKLFRCVYWTCYLPQLVRRIICVSLCYSHKCSLAPRAARPWGCVCVGGLWFRSLTDLCTQKRLCFSLSSFPLSSL